MKPNGIYYWLKKWDLIGINPDKAKELLGEKAIVKQGTVTETTKPAAAPVDPEKVIKELRNRITDYENELARWARNDTENLNRIAELIEDRDNWKRQAEMYRQQYDAMETDRDEIRQALADLEDKHELLQQTVKDYVREGDEVIALRLPIMSVAVANVERARIYEAVEALSDDVEAAEIDRERVMNELFDLLQRAVNFITADLAELHPRQDVTGYVREFFAYYNERHMGNLTDTRQAG